MTTVDVTYSFAELPSEISVVALAGVRKVYGIRSMQLEEDERRIRIEYDATRLSEPAVRQLLRRAGLTVTPEPLLDAVVPVAAAPQA